MVKSVLEYLENSAARFPDKKAVADDKSSMTYSELVNNARNIAAGLLPYTERRQAVPVYMDKSCHTLALFMGAVMSFLLWLSSGLIVTAFLGSTVTTKARAVSFFPSM